MPADKVLPYIGGTRYNIICAMCIDGVCAVASYVGSNNIDTVMHFLINHMFNQGGPMGKFPAPNSVLVLDNASYHHANNDLVTRFCEAHGALVVFLPAYSPDLNPIEQLFSAVKHRIRRDFQQLSNTQTPVADLKRIFHDVGTPQNARGWIDCSYGDVIPVD